MPETDALAALGGEIHFVTQRILYLRQHPNAIAGQDFVWDDDTAFGTTLLTGALFDLLMDCFGGESSTGDDLQSLLTDEGIEIRISLRRNPDASRPGYQFIKRIASSGLLAVDKGQLAITITGTSVDAAFPKWTGSGCVPFIAR